MHKLLVDQPGEKKFLLGNEAIARGALAAGCRFFAGYPITPATTIFNTMLKLLPPMGGVCLQGEDEIASIGFCLGAAMAEQWKREGAPTPDSVIPIPDSSRDAAMSQDQNSCSFSVRVTRRSRRSNQRSAPS